MERPDDRGMDRAGTPSNVRRLRRVGVVVASSDARFSRTAAFLLERAGYDVERTREPGRAHDAVARSRAGAVIIDGGDSVMHAARTAAALAAEHPSVRVLIVSEGRDRTSGAVPTFPKWGSLGRVIADLDHHFGVARGQLGGERGVS